MNKLTSVAGTGVTALALGLALVGCGGSDSTTEATSSAAASSSEEAEPTTSAEAAGPKETIQDYVKQNNLREEVVKPGNPGTPTVVLPVPAGWQQTDRLEQAPYGAIVFAGSKVPDNPPRILALMSKLTGDVDPNALLDYAPGELQNLPGWSPSNEGQRTTVSGYDAYQIGGAYDIDGRKGMIAQKTVVIPAEDGVFVLQLNAYSDESEAPILADATTAIDNEIVITP